MIIFFWGHRIIYIICMWWMWSRATWVHGLVQFIMYANYQLRSLAVQVTKLERLGW